MRCVGRAKRRAGQGYRADAPPRWRGLEHGDPGAEIHEIRVIFRAVSGVGTVKNVTITLDEETADWARLAAAHEAKSVSRFVGGLLRERMRDARSYDEAMRRYLARPPFRQRGPAERYPSRDELHQRKAKS